MRPLWRAAAWAGGALGAAVTGSVVGVLGFGRRGATTGDSPRALGMLDQLDVTQSSTVVTDDDVLLSAWEFALGNREKCDCTVVFLHGFTLDSRAWVFQLSEFAGSVDPAVRMVTYDQRGHGSSGVSAPGGSTLEQLAADLEAVLRSEVPTGPIVLVGHSMGGMVVLALAERCPELFAERVCAVALLGTSAGGLSDSHAIRPWLSRYNPVPRALGVLAGRQPDLVERVRHLGDGVARGVTRARAFGRNAVPASVVELVTDMIGATRVGVIADFLPTFAAHERAHVLHALNSCAVLVLSGADDAITPFRHAEAIAAALPHSRFVRAEGAGHSVMLEQPELVNDELAALVRSTCPRPGRRGRQS